MQIRDVLWLSCLIAWAAVPEMTPGQEPATPATNPVEVDSNRANPEPEQVARWIRGLRADQFLARETATLKLIEAGTPVIDPLVKALPRSNAEVTARIIHILRRLALSEAWTIDDPALQALQEIAKQEGTPAGRRASSTLLKLSEFREQRALQEIIKLGGNWSQQYLPFGIQRNSQWVIHIGNNWHGTAEDLKRLKWISSAEAVIFEGPKANDTWMSHLNGMKQLRSLFIKHATISDKGMQSVADLKGLVSLDIKYVPITDASLTHIQAPSQIRYVKLYGTNISKEGAVKLQNSLPAADVDHRNGAFLGVGCPQPPEPCIITTIQPDTAAQRANLRTGDWIVSFSGKPVVDFNDLRKLIGQWRPGDKTSLQVLRVNSPKFSQLRKTENVKADLDAVKHPIGLKLTKLDEASPWYKIGLRVDDVIHKINGERIIDAGTLKKELATVTNGELFQVIYYRQPKLEKYNVELGEWKGEWERQ